jgi:predicted Zn-dependent peptidase
MRKTITIISLLLLTFTSSATWMTGAAQEIKLPAYKRVALPNGLTLLLMEHHEVPVVSFDFIIRSGSVADPAGKEGAASLTAALLLKGTTTRSADDISNQLDFVGGPLGVGVTHDYTNGSAEFLRKDLTVGLDLMSDVLLNPTFPQAEVDKMLKQRIDGLKQAKDQPQAVIQRYFERYLYGTHPYGRPSGGDENSLKSITRDDIASFYTSHYAPNQIILAAVGDFKTEDMEAALREKFGRWPKKSVPTATVPPPADFKGKKLLLVDKPDATQTFYRIGNVGVAFNNPDWPQIDVIRTLFGGRFTSMLNSELRINSGLTYGASSFFDARKARGPFVVATFTRNEATERAMDMTLDILQRLHDKGITEEQLHSAKAYIKGQFPLEIETSDQLADWLTQLEFYGLDASYISTYFAKIDAMTVVDARRIIQQYFPQENLVFVLIGKADEIKKVVKKYAPTMEVKSITEPGF